MDVPMSWLKTFVPMDKPTSVFVEDITLSGSKVEAVRKLGAELSNVAVGRVLSLKKHENSDHLLVARVDAGSVVLQIVTGAPNIFEGALVPVALDGATLSGGAVIRTGRLRGELSEGMMCSIQELGHTPAEYPEAPEDGIYIFAEDSGVKPGDDALAALMLKDEVVEFEITSNRPDCFSVIGIARETAATYGLPLTLPEVRVRESAGGNIPDMISVEIQNPALCPRYIARALKNVRLAPSPLWMRQRLMACGVRPINNIVDITNYVMLEYGQPMHAFDIDNIARRKIIVRNARDGEVFTTLDGTARVLDASMLVIADPEKAVAIAGIMGGENSMVTENAAGILFEAACFDGTNVRLTSKKLGLRTDSSAKFEKGLDPNLALEAMNRACALAEELGCGEVVPGALDCYPRKREKKRVPFSAQRVNRLLGLERNGRPLTGNEMAALLERLEIRVENAGADGGDPGLCAVAPTFRPDIEIEADIAEEVARLYGYDRIEPTLTAGAPSVGRKTERQIMDDAVRNCMTAMGFHEALTYSFESPKVFDKLLIPENDTLRTAVTITNPLGEDYGIMRTTTLNSMLTSLSNNYSRRNPVAALFEAAKTYIPRGAGELPDEVNTLTAGMYGCGDFYTLKGAMCELFEHLGIGEPEFTRETSLPYTHPGRTARIRAAARPGPSGADGSVDLGWIGEAHPDVLDNYEIGERACLAVINLDAAFSAATLERVCKPLPKFPAMERDIAVIVGDGVENGQMLKIIAESGGEFLESAALFDVYRGAQVGEGMKSAAYRLVFRCAERTLKDAEAAEAVDRILAGLREKAGAVLR